ncbi:MAG: histidine--tRNA ligase [Microbacteriaceae bacterium]|jgi:histidyl-tRNA synthetase|nr:histidine--tRNA ligase [Microbacteriaceae bacterium]
MASPVNAPRGMRDFLPAEKATRERVLGVIRDTYRSHGFDEIETPVMEDSARLHAGLGGDNEKLAFGVLKRGLTTDDLRAATDALELADLGLRFDLTVPLARFYASHRAELPKVFRSIQIAPVWRAERPQKGRYRQFMQCDIDIIGEPGPLAEVELISATAATVRALGIAGCRININDRRLLTSMLTVLGFPASAHAAVLITLDKLDKLGVEGVISELKDRVFPDEPVAALAAFLHRPTPSVEPEFGEATIRASLPEGADETAIAELAALGTMLSADDRAVLTFDPFLVRGMGYYTGTIFEVTHPEFGYSLAGGGRYDGMIGRFLGTDVAAAGFSLGFERLVDLVDLPDLQATDAAALLYDDRTDPARLLELKSELIATGARVRLERSTKNTRALLDSLAAQGFGRVAAVRPETATIADLEWRELG